jgi:hypothetical protein
MSFLLCCCRNCIAFRIRHSVTYSSAGSYPLLRHSTPDAMDVA